METGDDEPKAFEVEMCGEKRNPLGLSGFKWCWEVLF